jgi:hypothetical protein
LIRIESKAFFHSSLESIEIPRNVEILGSSCFSDCESLSSISFEPDSQLKHIETQVFHEAHCSVIIPSTIIFISYFAVEESHQISIDHIHLCPKYDRWKQLRTSGMMIDFRRICRFNSGLPSLSDCLFDFSSFTKGSWLSENNLMSTQIYHGCDDGLPVVVKFINLPAFFTKHDVETAIENFMNLRHPCIAGAVGVVVEPLLRGLRIVRTFSNGGSLSEVISAPPEWWTPTAKTKAVVGLALGLRFVHRFGLVHGHLTCNNVLFNENGMVQITDLCMNTLVYIESEKYAKTDLGGFSENNWTPQTDIRAFLGILSEIMVRELTERGGHCRRIPSFVSEMIERGHSSGSNTLTSFQGIFNILKRNKFRIMEGVDSKNVSDFVKWIKSSERLIK